MRIIDQKDVIKSDFVLVSGDTVSNMDLAPALAAHRQRRAADKNAIMTMVSTAQDARWLACIVSKHSQPRGSSPFQKAYRSWDDTGCITPSAPGMRVLHYVGGPSGS